MNRLYHTLNALLKQYFDLSEDKADEQATIEQIRQGVRFRGANLWILAFAILIASLGLNVNSTAVIIGAMLISPLMGPILGMGLGIGIVDLDLLRRSLNNYLVAVLISVLTATLYFLLTPLSEAQSELLSRTSPTLYDVLIALCGGAAGIIAMGSKAKGNVLAGVAIATALMPPLCTAGFGLATMQWNFFFGAFYLFFINTVFICLATFVGVRLFHFDKVRQIDPRKARHVQRYIWAIVLATMLPATYITYGIVTRSLRDSQAKRFIREQISIDGAQILSSHIDETHREIQVVALGREISQAAQDSAQNLLPAYNLQGYTLSVIQGTPTDSLLASWGVLRQRSMHIQEQLLQQNAKLSAAELRLQTYVQLETLSTAIAPEVRALFPQIAGIALGRSSLASTDSVASQPLITATLRLRPQSVLAPQDRDRLRLWIQERVGADTVQLLFLPAE